MTTSCSHVPGADPRMPCAHPECSSRLGTKLIVPEINMNLSNAYAAVLGPLEFRTRTYERRAFMFDRIVHWRWVQEAKAMTTFDGGATAIQRQDGTWVTPEDVEKMPLPKYWADLLSELWGATSLHGAVFRQPRGVVFWHCARCRVPTNPSGTRTWDGAATTAKQAGRLCEAVWMWRQQERDRFIEAQARNYVSN